MRNEGFNNAEGWLSSAFGAVSNIGTTAASKINTASGTKADVKAICGREPLFNGKGQHDEWLACASQKGNEIVETKNQLPIIVIGAVSFLILAGLGTFIYIKKG